MRIAKVFAPYLGLSLTTSTLLHVLVVLYFSSPSRQLTALRRLDIQYLNGVADAPLSKRMPYHQHRHVPSVAQSPPQDGPPLGFASAGPRDEVTSAPSPVLGSDLGLKVVYPRVSRVLGEEGRVVIELRLPLPFKPQKTIAKEEVNTSVALSSGHTRLDQAALEAVRLGLDNGVLKKPLSDLGKIQIGFAFKLSDTDVQQ